MQHLILFSFAALLLVALPSCAKKTTAAIGDDGVDWAARARQFKEDPASLRLFTEQCKENEAQLAAAQKQINFYRQQNGTSAQEIQQAQVQATSAQQQVLALQESNNQLKQQLATMAAAQQNDQVDTDKAVVQGVVFQVQLGAYAKNTLDPSLATENALELQDQNGVQKVVVSQFRTYNNAAVLRDRLKIMGVKDAFIVAKNNGQRITIPEALRMTGQG